MHARTLLQLAGGVLLISCLTACGGGGGSGNSSGGSGSGGGGTPTYTIGGTLNGLTSGAGVSLVLKNGSDTLTLSQNGSFTFPTAEIAGASYNVSVSTQPPFPQRCSLAGGSGTVNAANVTSISATCSTSITVTTLYSFQGIFFTTHDGATPRSGVVFDSQGNLYGTTSAGGAQGDGTVYKLSPDGKGGYTETVLHEFGSSGDGIDPSAVLLDTQGNLYGTTYSGGSVNEGTVFELKPDGSGGYTEKVLYSFTGGSTDGGNPDGGVIMDSQGDLYGTTKGYMTGDVFELKPDGTGGYTLSVLYGFSTSGCCDGAAPTGTLTLDSQGDLYGTTEGGGTGGGGTVYELKPNGGGYTESVLYRFLGGSDGFAPEAGVTTDSQGDLYGTTNGGGTNGNGTVFELKPDGSGGYAESVLYRFAGSFSGTIDGAGPSGAVIVDRQGNLFGTTAWGGITDDGIAFELEPNGSGGYAESILYSFGANTGPGPYAGLTVDAQGNLYGTVSNGGANGYGAVFEIE